MALHFLRATASAQGKRAEGMSPGLLDALICHDWPGNVRELANVIEREVSLLPSESAVLESLHAPLESGLSREFDNEPEPPSIARYRRGQLAAGMAATRPVVAPMSEVEKKAYLEALGVFKGNVRKAAQALGVSRSGFYEKLKKWGVAMDEEESER